MTDRPSRQLYHLKYLDLQQEKNILRLYLYPGEDGESLLEVWDYSRHSLGCADRVFKLADEAARVLEVAELLRDRFNAPELEWKHFLQNRRSVVRRSPTSESKTSKEQDVNVNEADQHSSRDGEAN